METILITILWVIVGFWVAYKRDWYSSYSGHDEPPASVIILLCVIFAPLSLIIAFFREMVIGKWKNN
jgi:hypothetical protein